MKASGRYLRLLCCLAICLAGNAKADTNEDAGDLTLGAAIYADNCRMCHQPDGGGEEGLYPSLQNPALLADKKLLIRTVLDGRTGHRQRGNGKAVRLMPRWDFLSDREIAAVIAFVTDSWGPQAVIVSAPEVAAARRGPTPP